MKLPKISSGRTLVMIASMWCALAILLILHHAFRDNPKSTAPHASSRQSVGKQPETRYDLPVRLKIPKLNVDAPIDQMGLTPEGDVQVPGKLQNAGWYKFGPHPGNVGSAVIAGHYGLSSNDTAIFNKLHVLNKGDLVRVEDGKGTTATFVVRELKTYSRDAVVTEVFSSSDKKAHLSLITCEGAWQKDQRTYSDRLVVFTDALTSLP